MNTKMARHSGTAAEVKLGKAEANAATPAVTETATVRT
jgi:hypothetical protein